jgi:hypothetical protein
LKDCDTELLHTGELQIAPCTQVLLDETVMEAGQLKETGLKNPRVCVSVCDSDPPPTLSL